MIPYVLCTQYVLDPGGWEQQPPARRRRRAWPACLEIHEREREGEGGRRSRSAMHACLPPMDPYRVHACLAIFRGVAANANKIRQGWMDGWMEESPESPCLLVAYRT
jgi:hypothetical protein